MIVAGSVEFDAVALPVVVEQRNWYVTEPAPGVSNATPMTVPTTIVVESNRIRDMAVTSEPPRYNDRTPVNVVDGDAK